MIQGNFARHKLSFPERFPSLISDNFTDVSDMIIVSQKLWFTAYWFNWRIVDVWNDPWVLGFRANRILYEWRRSLQTASDNNQLLKIMNWYSPVFTATRLSSYYRTTLRSLDNINICEPHNKWGKILIRRSIWGSLQNRADAARIYFRRSRCSRRAN